MRIGKENAMSCRVIVLSSVLLLAGSEGAAAQPDYQLIQPPQPTSSADGRIEIAEVFQYGCGACASFEPYLERWAETKPDHMDLVRVPAVWNALGELHARAFYTAEALGILDKTHAPFFRAFHADGNRLETKDKLRDFFARFDVTAQAFDATFDSFAVHTKVQRAKELVERYGIPETPSVVVDGRYLTLVGLAGSYERWFEIIERLAAEQAPGK
jgi:protein dithiol oxidoreductase (disulfide-forming)